MAGIAGAPAPKPQSIPAPIPGKEAEMTAEALFADAPTAEAVFTDATEDMSADVAAEIPEDQFAPEPSFAEANMPGPDVVENTITRIQTGLAANDTEKLNFLKSKFGENNAVMKKGKLYFRRSSTEKLKPLDPDTLEVINDLLPDFAREIVTEAAMLPGEMMGAAMGAVSGAAAGGIGAIPGAAAGGLMGRVASVPFANQAADAVAELAGVSADETRNRYSENLVGMGAEAVLPVVGRAILRRIPGTSLSQQAYKQAKEQGEREIVALSKQSQHVAESVQALKEQGRAAVIRGEEIGIPGANVSLMGHQLNPDNPILLNRVAQAAKDPRFINAQNQLAADWGDTLTNTLTEIGRRGNPGPLRPTELASRVTNAVTDLQKAEGQAIGKYRAQAMAKLKNQKLPLGPQATQQLQSLMTELGFKTQARGDIISIVPPKDINALVGKLGLTSPGEVRAVVNNVNELAQSAKAGGLRLADLDRLRNSMGATSDSLFRTQAGARLGSLTGELRKAYRTGIESGLESDFDRAAFNSAMDDFSALKENVAVLKNALNEDSSAKAIVNSFFTGKENLQKIKAIKQISPESFGALKEEWVNQLMTQFASRETSTGFKSSQFLDALDKKYGKEFVAEVLNDGPGPNVDTVKQILSVTERIEKMSKGMTADNMSEAQKKAIADVGLGLFANIKFKTLNGVTALMTKMGKKDSPLLDIMTRDGIDKYVANYPGRAPDKLGLIQKLGDALAQDRVYKAAMKAGAAGQRPLKAAVKEEMQDKAR